MTLPVLAVFSFAQSDPNQNNPQNTQSQPQSQTTTTEQRTESQTTTSSTEKVSTKSWKGSLVDANCVAPGMTSSTSTTTRSEVNAPSQSSASSSAADPSASSTTTQESRSTSEKTTEDPAASRTERQTTESSSSTEQRQDPNTGSVTERRSTADRTTQESSAAGGNTARWQSCPATLSTTQFGLVLSGGRMVRFDEVGNTRAAMAMKTNNKLAKAATSGKPAKVKVHGTMAGDTVQVVEIR
jgi:hypothetical protein